MKTYLPRRHGRLLRLRGRALRSVAEGQTGGRRRTAQRARRRLRRLLRRAQIRRPLRHAAAHRLQALPRTRSSSTAIRSAIAITRARSTTSCKAFRRRWRWLRSTKPTWISPAPSVCTARRSPPRICCTNAVKRETDAQLLHRHRHLAHGRESRLRPSQAERHPVGAARRGSRASWRRSTSARFRASAKSPKRTCTPWASARCGDLAALDEDFLEEHFGKWGLALAGKSRGLDAGGWFDGEVGEDSDPKSISHEHTFNDDTADVDTLESTLARLSRNGRPPPARAPVARPHRPAQAPLYGFHHHHARPFARPRHPARYRNLPRSRAPCSASNWKPKATIRLLGVQVSGLESGEGQLNLLAEDKTSRWRNASQRRRPHARPVRRRQRLARYRLEGPLPRARPRKSRRTARERTPQRVTARSLRATC